LKALATYFINLYVFPKETWAQIKDDCMVTIFTLKGNQSACWKVRVSQILYYLWDALFLVKCTRSDLWLQYCVIFIIRSFREV